MIKIKPHEIIEIKGMKTNRKKIKRNKFYIKNLENSKGQ